MIKIRLTLKDGRRFYVSEGWPYNTKAIFLKESFSDGLPYHTVLEFKVAWNIYNHREHGGVRLENPDYDYTMGSTKDYRINPEDVVEFEAINDFTLKKKTINMNKVEQLPKSKVLRFPLNQFNMLKRHPYTSCHWTYIDDKCVAFSTDEDYPKINKIQYYTRGLTGLIWDAFCYRNTDKISMFRNFYDSRRELLFNPIIHKVWLRNDLGSCEMFTIKPITLPK